MSTITTMLRSFLTKPWFVVLAVAVGITTGLRWPDVGRTVGLLGNTYLSFLSMCALPIIIFSIMACVGRAMHDGVPGRRLLVTAATFVLGGVMAACLGMTIMLFLGDVSDEVRSALGRTFMAAERTESAGTMGAWDLVNSLVTDNIFSALSSGHFLACVFFSMLFGAALGFARNSVASGIISALTAFGDAFNRMMRWGLLFLAPGLFCMTAGQMAGMHLEILAALGQVVLLYLLGCALLCLLHALVLWRGGGCGVWQVANGLGPCAGMAFVAASSALAMPLAFEGMEKDLRHRPDIARFTIPLGMAINRQAYAMLFAMTGVFTLRMQGMEATPGALVTLCLCSVLAGMPASGSPAVISPMVAYVLAPVGVPASLGVGILVVISPMIDAVASMTNLVASCAASGIVDSMERNSAT